MERSASSPSTKRVEDKYRTAAVAYDRRTRWFEHFRAQAVARLAVSTGDTVIDVGCGTGVNFPLIERRVGPDGHVIGVDVSPDMLSRAAAKAAGAGYRNVTLIQSAAEDADLSAGADAALFSLTHDVLQQPSALENVFRSLRAGAGVASFGSKWAPRWRVPVNAYVRWVARRYVTTFEGFERPWRHLEDFTRDLRVEEVALGGAYIAWGTAPEPSRAAERDAQ